MTWLPSLENQDMPVRLRPYSRRLLGRDTLLQVAYENRDPDVA